MKIIRGSGGDSGGSQQQARVAVESPDSLKSQAFAQVVDLLSEGEIEGLVNGLQSVYLDGTPIQTVDNGGSVSSNFSGVNLEFRTGTQSQPYIPGFAASENEFQVGVEFKLTSSLNTPFIRTFTNPELDAVKIRVSIPQLTDTDQSTGDLRGSRLEYKISLRSNGGSYEVVSQDRIIGKSSSKYERSYRIDLTGEPPWDIKVERITQNSSTTYVQNRTFVESITEIIDGKFRYPNSAIAAIRVDSSQFSSVPSRAYHVRGVRVRVPINYNPETRIYGGVWSGQYYTAYTNNPAWIFLDLLTSSRYGLGQFLPEAQIDKWALYSIAKYCDELVPDGQGGYEPRFTCNCYIQSREEAFKIMQDLASCFRGMTYWANGSLVTVQDSPSDPAYLFTPSNVVDGMFNYQGSSAKARHTVALVTWNDPEDFYRRKVEYVEDVDGIARYGIVETQIAAFGCTSRSQANRVGRWLLYTEQHQTETVTFKAGLEGSYCRPGQVIKVADPTRAGARRGGRIYDATTTTVTIDQAVSIDPSTHTLSVVLPDGTIDARPILSISDKVITVSTPFTTTPQKASVWMIESNQIQAQLFKIVGISEAGDGSHEITALAHDDQKYDAVENNLVLEARSISLLSETPDSPIGVTLTETLYAVGSDVRVKVTVSWNKVPNASSYIVQYYRDSLNAITLPETVSNDVEILNAEPGTYYVTVWAVNSLGVKSSPSKAFKKIIGKTLPPSNVLGLSLLPMANVAYISWEIATDLDVLIGGNVRIRFSPDIVTPVWKDAVDIVPALPGNATRVQAPLLTGSYMAKFVDSSGVASNDEALIITTIPAPLALNIVQTIDEAPTFPGTKTDIEYFAEYNGIGLSAGLLIDSVTDLVDSIVNWDFAGGVAPVGTYDFAGSVDLGAAYTSRITASIQAEAVDVADFIDMREELVDDWIDLDGEFIDDVNAELFLKTTTDDPSSGGAVWTDWKRFFVGDYLARGIKFQLRIKSESYSHNMIVKALAVTVDMPDRTVNLSGLVSGTSSYTVTYPEPFKVAPVVGITAKNMSTGDYYRITSESNTGFTITFYNSSATIISRNFDVFAKGYGRAI